LQQCGAGYQPGYQPAAARRAAFVFHAEKPAESRLPADSPPRMRPEAVFTQTRQEAA
jgi:hypothetical protein